MKMLAIFILLMSSLTVYAIHNTACIFNEINPSATNTALGKIGGGANIWNQNPLDVWSNPAKLGYFKGVSVGYLHNSWYGEVFDDIYFNSSYLTVGWKGLGLMIPMINNQLKFGTSFEYGSQDMFDENANYLGSINSWESSSGFALGINLYEFYGAFNSNETFSQLQAYSDFSIGYNYNFIRSNLPPEGVGNTEIVHTNGNTHSDGLGLIWRISPLNEKNYSSNCFFKADLVSSLYFRNISKTNLDNGENIRPLLYSTDAAISFRMAMGIDNVKEIIASNVYDKLSIFCSDIISVNGNYGSSYIMDCNGEWGKGIDLTILDIVSFRWGYYQDSQGDLEGKTSGMGFNLRYKNLIHLQYNFAKFPGGDLQEFQEREDFMLNVNLLDLLGKGN